MLTRTRPSCSDMLSPAQRKLLAYAKVWEPLRFTNDLIEARIQTGLFGAAQVRVAKSLRRLGLVDEAGDVTPAGLEVLVKD